MSETRKNAQSKPKKRGAPRRADYLRERARLIPRRPNKTITPIPPV